MLTASLAHADIPRPSPEQLSVAKCSLDNCWKEMLPALRDTITDSTAVIQAYMDRFNEKLAKTESAAKDNEQTQDLALAHRIALLRQYLDECEDLKRGPGFERHLFIVGHQFNTEETIFEAAAHTAYADLMKSACGNKPTQAAYLECQKRIVIKRDVDKADLAIYMRFLGKGSGASITYVGHGLKNALVMGQKNLLLPRDWDPTLKIGYKEWVKRNSGMLYTEELDAFEGELVRVIKPKAPVKLFACNTGLEFARHLKAILDGSSVTASTVGMHFEYLDADGQPQPIPEGSLPSGTQYVLVPDAKGAFYDVPAKRAPAAEPSAASEHASKMPVEDRIARDLILRVAINSADHATVDDGTREIYFSKKEQTALLTLMGNKIVHHELKDPLFNLSKADEMLAQASVTSKTPEDQKMYQELGTKLHDLMRESQKLYY